MCALVEMKPKTAADAIYAEIWGQSFNEYQRVKAKDMRSSHGKGEDCLQVNHVPNKALTKAKRFLKSGIASATIQARNHRAAQMPYHEAYDLKDFPVMTSG